MKVSIDNYRIIEKAELEIEGITLIRGQNDSGKSCVMRALRTAVMNSSSDDQIRYGAPEFKVAIDVSGRRLEFSRRRKGSPLLILDGTSYEKLGRQTVPEIDPTFPLKVFKFQAGAGDVEKFLPNFVFQGETPVFGQVDVYSFFSAMFDTVARLSRHLLVVRKRVSEATSDVSKSKAQVESLHEMALGLSQTLSQFDEAAILSQYASLQEAREVAKRLAAAQIRVGTLDRSLLALARYAVLKPADFAGMESRYEDASGMLLVMAKLKSSHEHLEQTQYRLRLVQWAEQAMEPLQSLVDYDSAAARLVAVSERRIHASSELDRVRIRVEAARFYDGKLGHVAQQLTRSGEVDAANLTILRMRQAVRKLTHADQRSGYIGNTVEPFLGVLGVHLKASDGRRKVSDMRYDAGVHGLAIAECQQVLSGFTSCPVCGSQLERSLDTYIGGSHG